MHADRELDRDLERLVRTTLDAEAGPHPVWAEAPASRRITAQRRYRVGRWPKRILVVAAVLTLSGGALAAFIGGRPAPQTAAENGWVAFSLLDQRGIYLVRDGQPAHLITERDDVNVQACPAFSTDGHRIAYGQATGSASTGYADATLVIADVTPVGGIAGSESVQLPGMSDIPCGTWSRDGRWIAFGVPGPPGQTDTETNTLRGIAAGEGLAEEVWIVDTRDRSVRKLTGLAASDIEWSPATDQLAIANGSILLYDVTNDRAESVEGPIAVLDVTWAPDGRRLAYETPVERTGSGGTCSTTGFCRAYGEELWVLGVDGGEATRIATGYETNHGIGPVWSPDGTRIAYQRICQAYPTIEGSRSPCREQHEVVVVPVATPGTDQATSGPLVITPPRTNSPSGPVWWFPFSVTWSPDSTTLLYHAWTEGDAENAILTVAADGSEHATLLFNGPIAIQAGTPWSLPQSWARSVGD